MMQTQVFKVSGPHVAAKLMDGELVVINLRNGLYYSTIGVGVRIWQGVENGASVEQITDDIVHRFAVEGDQAAPDVTAFIGKLETESLVEATDAEPVAPTTEAGIERQPYESPSLTTFDDMEETFALDPPLRL